MVGFESKWAFTREAMMLTLGDEGSDTVLGLEGRRPRRPLRLSVRTTTTGREKSRQSLLLPLHYTPSPVQNKDSRCSWTEGALIKPVEAQPWLHKISLTCYVNKTTQCIAEICRLQEMSSLMSLLCRSTLQNMSQVAALLSLSTSLLILDVANSVQLRLPFIPSLVQVLTYCVSSSCISHLWESDITLPSLTIPTVRHFWKRQNWQRFLLLLSTGQSLLARHTYFAFFCTVRCQNQGKGDHYSLIVTYTSLHSK